MKYVLNSLISLVEKKKKSKMNCSIGLNVTEDPKTTGSVSLKINF